MRTPGSSLKIINGLAECVELYNTTLKVVERHKFGLCEWKKQPSDKFILVPFVCIS